MSHPKHVQREGSRKRRERVRKGHRNTRRDLQNPKLSNYEKGKKGSVVFYPHPCRLPHPPVHTARHPSGNQAKRGYQRGLKQPRGISPEPLPPLPILHTPELERVFLKASILPTACEHTHGYRCIHIHGGIHAQTHADFS